MDQQQCHSFCLYFFITCNFCIHLILSHWPYILLITSVCISPLEIQALLLSDCLLLLQRGPDDRLQLKYPSRWLGGGGAGTGESKTFFSPLVKLDSLLVRSVATGNIVLMFISSAPHLHPMSFNLAKLLFVSRQQSPLCDQHHREANL